MTSYPSNIKGTCTLLDQVMKTKLNYKGESYEVTFDKPFTIESEYVYEFILKREEDIDEEIMKLFGTDIRIQIATIGCVVLFTNLPRAEKLSLIPYNSNAPLLEGIYAMVENGDCI